MQHLGRLYVRYLNREYRRSGTLWEGRYKSRLVQDEHYLLSCYRYIELKPVRWTAVSSKLLKPLDSGLRRNDERSFRFIGNCSCIALLPYFLYILPTSM